mmetsp:Transcript_28808/g.68607  ORF Transcript_28808/g.68607 Transcript_28808/m.68607 type:complete len:245 (-) Transcript_28808:1973-2707(-)
MASLCRADGSAKGESPGEDGATPSTSDAMSRSPNDGGAVALLPGREKWRRTACPAALSTMPPMHRSAPANLAGPPSAPSPSASAAPSHTTARTMAPSRNRRSCALVSPQRDRNAAVPSASSAGGPRSTTLRDREGSIRIPTATHSPPSPGAVGAAAGRSDGRDAYPRRGAAPRTGSRRHPSPSRVTPPTSEAGSGAEVASPFPAERILTDAARSPRARRRTPTIPRRRDSSCPRSCPSAPHARP